MTTLQPLPSDGTAELMMMIIIPAMNAAIEPTDRSMPPDVMTKVAPIAMMPMNEARATILARLLIVRKWSLRKAPSTISSASARSGPNMPSRGRDRRICGAASPAVVVMLRLSFRCPSGAGRSAPR